MDKPFFSIVMPVYNVEKYLKQAVESVLSQTFTDFELLLVDDCSPDKSGALCDALAKEDERLRVMHLEKNSGVSEARNIGRRAAKGQYLMFMDSDDTVESALLSDVYASLQDNRAQVVVFGMSEDVYDAQGTLVSEKAVCCKECQFKAQQELRQFIMELEESTLYGYACNKFYDLAYLNSIDLDYTEHALLEDLFFNAEYFENIETMNVLSKPYYHYRLSLASASRTGQFVPEYFSLHKEKIKRLYMQQKRWNVLSEDAEKTLGNLYVRYLFSALQRNCDANAEMSHKDRKAFLNAAYEDAMLQELLPHAASDSKAVQIMGKLLNRQSILGTLSLARVIYIVKTKCPALFSKAKQMR